MATLPVATTIPATPRVRLRMAVRAQDTQVLETVIGAIAVDMVELQRCWQIPPAFAETHLAPSGLDPLGDESTTKRVGGVRRAGHEDHRQGPRPLPARRSLPTPAPALSIEVSGVQSKSLDAAAHEHVGATARLQPEPPKHSSCLLYTSDAADDLLCVDLGGRRIIKKKTTKM